MIRFLLGVAVGSGLMVGYGVWVAGLSDSGDLTPLERADLYVRAYQCDRAQERLARCHVERDALDLQVRYLRALNYALAAENAAYRRAGPPPAEVLPGETLPPPAVPLPTREGP